MLRRGQAPALGLHRGASPRHLDGGPLVDPALVRAQTRGAHDVGVVVASHRAVRGVHEDWDRGMETGARSARVTKKGDSAPRGGTKKGGALNLVTRPRKGPPGRLGRVSCRRCRAGGFHGCGGYPRAAETRVVRATSIDRGVVPPNRRLPRTNDFFGAVNGIEVGSNDRAALTCIVVLGLRHDQRPRRRHVSSLRLFHIDRRALGPRDAPAGRPGHGHVFFFGPPNGTPLSFLSLRASTDPRDLLPRIP